MRRLTYNPVLWLASAGLLLSACGGDPEAQVEEAATPAQTANADDVCGPIQARVEDFLGAAPAAADPVVAGGIANLAGGMNAFVSADYLANQHQVYVNLMTLVRFNSAFELEPYLAESWDLSSDGTTLTMAVRPGVFWHDGEETDAADVAFTFERLVDPETGFPNAAAFAKYESVEVVDPMTVRFTIEPHATALSAWRTVAIMPEHIFADVPAAELGAHPFGTQCPVGNGPFRFVEYVEGERWRFDANPRFPAELGGAPSIGSYVYRVIPEETTLHLELMAGALDLFVAPSPDVALSIQESEDARLVHFPFRQSAFVAWNGRRAHLSDARVRTALALGTDREAIVDALLGGFGEVAQTGVPPMHFAFDEAAGRSLGHDPARAARLLDEAGWSDRDGDGVREDEAGTPLQVEILYNQGNAVREQIAQIMQAQLAEVGVQVVPSVVEWGTLLGRIMDPTTRDFDGVVMGWLPEFEMDESGFFHSSKIDEPLAWAGLQDARLDRIMDALRNAQSSSEAEPLWREFQQRVVELQPFTYLYYQERLEGVSARMSAIPMDARGEWAQIMDWRVAPSSARVAVR